ncbi:MAG TPA: hypothetical protein VFZ61_33230, partial [Polyangiales bacterium]
LVFVCLLAIARGAAAHGGPPAATAVLAEDTQGVQVVRLSQGLAHRSGDGFRFVCPEAWGGDVGAGAATLPDGAALIGGEALFLIEPDGRVAPHPEELGVVLALASGGGAAFGLFQQGPHTELRRIERATTQLLRTFDEPFQLLAASGELLAVLRFSQRTLVVQSLAPDGALRERVSWDAPSSVAQAALRAEADQLYVLIWGKSAPWVTLGRLGAASHEQLAEAQSAISGPLTLAETSLIARDGTLEELRPSVALSARGQHVTCVDRLGELAYACIDGGLARVDAHGLGAPLFELSSLREPDYQLLHPARRGPCMLRWLDLQLHMREAAAHKDETELDAGAPPAAGADGGTFLEEEVGGCAVGGSASGAARHVGLLALALLGGVTWRSRRRAQQIASILG